MFISPFEIVTTVGLRKPYPNDWVKISHQKSSWISWTQEKDLSTTFKLEKQGKVTNYCLASGNLLHSYGHWPI